MLKFNLLTIINNFYEGKYSLKWKRANIVPVHNKEGKQ